MLEKEDLELLETWETSWKRANKINLLNGLIILSTFTFFHRRFNVRVGVLQKQLQLNPVITQMKASSPKSKQLSKVYPSKEDQAWTSDLFLVQLYASSTCYGAKHS